MPRINIEDSLYTDNRFIELCIKCGGRSKALGELVSMWLVAQKFYLSHGEIPNAVWVTQNLSEDIVICGLAIRTKTGVQARGQDEQFAWLLARRSAGQKSAKARKSSKGTAQPKPRTAVRETPNTARTAPNESQPLPLSLSLSPSLSLSQSLPLAQSLKKEEEKENTSPAGFKKTRAGTAHDQDLCRRIWAAYQSAYRDRYKVDPTRNATVNTQIVNLSKRLGEEAVEVIKFYVQHNSGFYVGKCHPIGVLLVDAESMRTQWARGKTITQNDVRQHESQDHYKSQMERIRSGEL